VGRQVFANLEGQALNQGKHFNDQFLTFLGLFSLPQCLESIDESSVGASLGRGEVRELLQRCSIVENWGLIELP
jgi:hypothetical protein